MKCEISTLVKCEMWVVTHYFAVVNYTSQLFVFTKQFKTKTLLKTERPIVINISAISETLRQYYIACNDFNLFRNCRIL